MGDPNDTPSWASGPAIDEEDDAPAWAGGPAIEEAPAPRQGGDEDSPVGKPLRSMEAKQGDAPTAFSYRTGMTQLDPIEVEGSTEGRDVAPSLSARSRPTILPETQVEGETSAFRPDRVLADLPAQVTEGIDTVRRLRHEREQSFGQATPLDTFVRPDAPRSPAAAPAPAPEAIDFSPRAVGLGAANAVPFAERAAAGLGAAMPGGGTYEENQGRIRGVIDENAREHPTETQVGANASLLAQIAAAPTFTARAGEALAARGVGGVGQAAGRMAVGAAEGAAWNAATRGGQDRDDATSPGYWLRRLRDAGEGAAYGVAPEVIGSAARAGTHVRRELASGAGNMAADMRIAAAGPNSTQFARAGDRFPGGRMGLAQEMERQGMTGAAMTAPQIVERAAEVARTSGAEMGRILRAASGATDDAARAAGPGTAAYREAVPDALGLDRSEIAARIHREVIQPLEAQPGAQGRRAARELNVWLDDFQTAAETLTPEAAHDLQVQLAGHAAYDAAKPTAVREGYAAMRRIMGERVDDAIESAGARIGDAQLAQRYADARRAYAAAARIGQFTGAARDGANRIVSLTDTIAGAGALAAHASSGNVAGAAWSLASMGANRYLRRREKSLAGTGLEALARRMNDPALIDSISPAMRSLLGNAIRRGPAIYAAAVHAALQTASPEDREFIQTALDGGAQESTP